MKPALFEARYYETYFVANVINNVLADPMPYVRNLDEFYGDLLYVRFLEPFQKFSAFHQFIEFIVEALIFEALDKVDLDKQKSEEKRFENIPSMKGKFRDLPINGALHHYMIEHQSFVQWLDEHGKTFEVADEDDANEYYAFLQESGVYGSLVERIVEEVFFIMFLNRHALMRFHELVAGVISDIEIEEVEFENRKWFARDGVLRRETIPQWAKKAVFYRDRGRCVLCNRDLSNLISLQNEENFDHLVPLVRGGINDVTNLQLLCAECNRKKSGGEAMTSVLYEKWY
jgi:hypothetical protein